MATAGAELQERLGATRLRTWRTHASSRASTVATGTLKFGTPAAAAHAHPHATAHAHASHGAHATNLQMCRLGDLCHTSACQEQENQDALDAMHKASPAYKPLVADRTLAICLGLMAKTEQKEWSSFNTLNVNEYTTQFPKQRPSTA